MLPKLIFKLTIAQGSFLLILVLFRRIRAQRNVPNSHHQADTEGSTVYGDDIADGRTHEFVHPTG